MTREECIYYLGKVEYMDANEKEAINMAIKDLEELPKRREEAKRWKSKALQAELVKHGEWKYCFYKDINDTYVGVYECTVCKQREYSAHKYCPNCGAKMDKE